ncbi:MAG TPA: tRNA (guanosine(46)-N7)-methyltransferase TrmB [Thermoanaerobaculia bacterium]|nr:tRNA (guanosine(46)-N7)-methyltransferase TrmB [Thermoanaerobaculia bacterium]
MIQPLSIATLAGERGLADTPAPLPLDELVPGTGAWEIEIGFGKGRYLLRRCQEDPGRRFLGIELATEYWQLFVEKARRRGLANWVALRGDALALIAAVLPHGFASAVHVYFPDPWPKSRHHKRRLFDPETVDLVLSLLAPGGRLLFATDFLEYGETVAEILASYPGLHLTRRDRPWDEGPRTNYEAKYLLEGRPILRLEATLEPGAAVLHPRGAQGVLAACP